MTTDRLTDEELAELDSMSEAAEGCDCGCASSRAAFGCADAIPVLLAEVRELRAGGEMRTPMAERLSDEELGDLERLAERAGRHAPLGLWSSEALLRLIAEVRELRAERKQIARAANIISDVAAAFGDEYPARVDSLAEAHGILAVITAGKHRR